MDATSRSAPTTCPFLAFTDDRQHRADAPDGRHRCHASITPTQIPLAHQDRFCLQPAFPGCPVFREWAAAVGATGPGGRPGAGGITPGLAAGPAAAMGDAGGPEAPPRQEVASEPDPDRGFGWGTQAADAAAPARPAPGRSDTPHERYAPPAPAEAPSRVSPDAAVLDATPGAARRSAGERVAAGPPGEGRTLVTGTPDAAPMPVPAAAPIRRLSLASDLGRGGRRRDRRGLLPALAGLAGLFLLFFLLPMLLGGRTGGPAGTTATPTGAAATTGGTGTTPTTATGEPTGTRTGEPTVTPTPGPTPTASVPASGQGRTYTVQPGDTFCAIARRFGVSSAELLAANPEITDPDRIQAGQRIRIPTPGSVSPRPDQSAPPC